MSSASFDSESYSKGSEGKQNDFVGEQVVARGVRHEELAVHEQVRFVAEPAVFRDAKMRAVFFRPVEHLGERAVGENRRHGGPGGIFLRLFDCVSGFLLH